MRNESTRGESMLRAVVGQAEGQQGVPPAWGTLGKKGMLSACSEISPAVPTFRKPSQTWFE